MYSPVSLNLRTRKVSFIEKVSFIQKVLHSESFKLLLKALLKNSQSQTFCFFSPADQAVGGVLA